MAYLRLVRLVLFLLALLSGPSWAASTVPDAADWPALMRGETLVRDVSNTQGIPGIRVLFTVRSDRGRVWRALVDYTNFRKVFPDVERLKVLREDAAGAEVQFWISVSWIPFDYTLYRSYEQPTRRLSWKRIEGSFNHISGSWEILGTDDPQRLLVIYESYLDIGFVVPLAMVRRGAADRAEAMVGRFRSWVEGG